MTITTAEQILLVILCSFLAIFLIVLIFVLVWLFEILRSIRRIMKKAEELTDKAEHIADFFKKTAPTIALGKLVSNVAESVIGKHFKSNSKGDKD